MPTHREKPHIGNTYEIILADSIARYKRFEGYDVFFQTGTDEHGQKIELKAQEAGISPKEYVDGVAGQVKEIWDMMNTSYDKFIRTTDAPHEKQVQKIFKRSYMTREIFTKDIMRECIVHLVNHFYRVTVSRWKMPGLWKRGCSGKKRRHTSLR